MNFTETRLKGAYVVDIRRIEDDRGFFARAWCQNEFTTHELNPGLAQLNVGYTRRRGTVRGMHYQRPPWEEAKLVRCTRGAVYDVLIDLRRDSPTHGQWVGVELTGENHRMLYAPAGFAHGYQALTDDTEVYYQTTQFYAPEYATGVRFDDPAFGIAWPLSVELVSVQDRSWPAYAL